MSFLASFFLSNYTTDRYICVTANVRKVYEAMKLAGTTNTNSSTSVPATSQLVQWHN